MYVHNIAMVWDQKRDDWEMHAGPHIFAQNYAKGGEAATGRQVDMHTCIDVHILTKVWDMRTTRTNWE